MGEECIWVHILVQETGRIFLEALLGMDMVHMDYMVRMDRRVLEVPCRAHMVGKGHMGYTGESSSRILCHTY